VRDSEAEVARRVADLLGDFGLDRYRDTFISSLSTGTRRVVELACAVAHNPSVVLLDEPSSGIAQREIEGLAELLFGLRDRTGATLVVIEHDMSLVSTLADRMVCLHLGKVLSEGTPAQVLDDPAVGAAYLGTDQTALSRSGPTGALLTVAEYADRYSVSNSTVRRRVDRGELEAVREGRRLLVRG
jgi:branched-chain amino acid transport system ATP-binding protein